MFPHSHSSGDQLHRLPSFKTERREWSVGNRSAAAFADLAGSVLCTPMTVLARNDRMPTAFIPMHTNQAARRWAVWRFAPVGQEGAHAVGG